MANPDFTSADLRRGETLFKGPCTFVKGVVRIDDLPRDGRPEIAFAGRSNVGKSSLINALTGQKSLARVSVTPGRTRELNFFTLGKDGRLLLVDMPGYGYARASKAEVKGWTRLIRDYLKGRRELKRVFLLIDARHGLKESDRETMALTDEAAVRAAYPAARGESRFGGVVVESFLTGNDYRCLVVGGVLRAVAQRVPAHVDGDGKHTITELVEITNADPRRGIGHEKVLTRIQVDDESTSYAIEQGYALDAVPRKGTRVFLKRTGNMSTGGISIDRTEEIHPENAEIAEQAA